MIRETTTWLVAKFKERFGRTPHVCDIIEQGDLCAKLQAHLFDPLSEFCIRCGKSRSAMEDAATRAGAR